VISNGFTHEHRLLVWKQTFQSEKQHTRAHKVLAEYKVTKILVAGNQDGCVSICHRKYRNVVGLFGQFTDVIHRPSVAPKPHNDLTFDAFVGEKPQ